MADHTDTLLGRIDETAVEALDLADRERAREKGRSQRAAYEKGLREVERVAGKPQARELAEWIQDEIEDRETFPSAREVRNQGATICRRSGHDVSTNDWLGA
jgi:cytochrome P450